MAADTNVGLMLVLLLVGRWLILAGFFAWIRSRERAGKEALLSTSLFHNRTSNLALVTQNVQWLVLLASPSCPLTSKSSGTTTPSRRA